MIRRRRTSRMIRVLAAASLMLSAAAHGASSHDLLREGNTLYDAGRYDEAIERYEQIERDAPDRLAALFNQACALYELEHYDEAASLFEEIDIAGADDALRAAARFNLGHTHHSRAMQQMTDDPQRSLTSLEKSERAFREAIDLGRGDLEAGRNIERVRQLIETLRSHMQPQQDESQQDQSQQDQSQQGESSQEQSGQEPQDSTDGQAGETDQTSAQQQDLAQALDDLAQAQQQAAQLSDAVDQAQDQMTDEQTSHWQDQLSAQQEQLSNQTNDLAEQMDGALDDAQQEQQAAREAIEGGRFDEAAEHQRKAADAIKQAGEQGDEQPQSQPDEQEVADAGDEQPEQADSDELGEPDERDALAAEILDKERRDHEARESARRDRSRAKQVEKDW
ncbi:MAG: tetratricopeptide repeat protein [Phycisphaerales bacterium]|nr:tetratricopeptide repeat protein [Phycisphaerales bacterium]